MITERQAICPAMRGALAKEQPTKWRAIDKRTGQWVEGWYVEHHWVEQAGKAVYADAHPCIFCDELGERGKGGYWHYIDPATLQPVKQKSQQLSLF